MKKNITKIAPSLDHALEIANSCVYVKSIVTPIQNKENVFKFLKSLTDEFLQELRNLEKPTDESSKTFLFYLFTGLWHHQTEFSVEEVCNYLYGHFHALIILEILNRVCQKHLGDPLTEPAEKDKDEFYHRDMLTILKANPMKNETNSMNFLAEINSDKELFRMFQSLFSSLRCGEKK